jgi:hypothetical protein
MFCILIKAKEPNFSSFGHRHLIGMVIYILAGVDFNSAVVSNIIDCFEGRKYNTIAVI